MLAFGSTHDILYALTSLTAKEFKVRYRNMSLGILWSLANPIIMMSVLTFVFTFVIRNDKQYFPLFLLMGILPYNFFCLAWTTGTISIADNAVLVKKIPFPRELIPFASVLANALHYLIQLGLLLLAAGIVIGPSPLWIWLPVIFALQILFVSGLSLCSAALNVYFRDTRYVVESAALVLFWLVPIFYSFAEIEQMAEGYSFLRTVLSYNPLAATILCIRKILLYGELFEWGTLVKLAAASLASVTIGLTYFRRVQRDFADYL